MRAQRVRGGESRVEMQFAKWTAEGAVKGFGRVFCDVGHTSVAAFEYLSRIEGIIPAIESAHAVAYAKKIVPQMDKDEIVVITLSGRGDKDCAAIARYRGENIHE